MSFKQAAVSILHSSGSQTVVNIPLVVHEGLQGRT